MLSNVLIIDIVTYFHIIALLLCDMLQYYLRFVHFSLYFFCFWMDSTNISDGHMYCRRLASVKLFRSRCTQKQLVKALIPLSSNGFKIMVTVTGEANAVRIIKEKESAEIE